MDQAATFLGQKNVKTAEEIASLIGIISGGSVGLFHFLKWMCGKDLDSGITFKNNQTTGTTIINIVGDGNSIAIPSEVVALASDPEAMKKVRSVLQPLEKEGYSDLSFLDGTKEVSRIEKKEAGQIIAAPPLVPTEEPQQSTSTIRGLVRIKSPQYEGAAKWSLLWNGRAIDAEMSGQASEWVKGFQENRNFAPPGTVLDVSMTETVKLDSRGMVVAYSKHSYVVTEIHKWTPPATQMTIDFGNGDNDKSP